MNKKFVSLTLLSAIVALTFSMLPVKPQNITTLYVEPQLTTIKPLRTFEINISIANVTDLAGWEFKLYYSNSLLNATEIREGPFLKTAGGTFFTVKEFTDNYNETHGRIWAACVLEGQGPGANGTGTLAIITFKTKLNGTAILHLAETDLIDSKMPPNHISHITVDGNIKILNVDISILNVETSKTIVGQGFPVNISVTIKNLGETIETFNLTIYVNTTSIASQVTTLPPGDLVILQFMWNTTGWSKGNYIISAYATPVLGETDTENNMLTGGSIIVGVPCDLTGSTPGMPDGICDMRDIGYFCKKFMTTPSNPDWDPNADVTGPTPKVPDNIVDMRDIGEACKNFMKTDP